jgi:hypothetical protein
LFENSNAISIDDARSDLMIEDPTTNFKSKVHSVGQACFEFNNDKLPVDLSHL